ncbi:FimV/HubP family polar landmark protein [Pandoraea sp. CB10b_02]|uniref:FimV/HubP family polar landmark protein n=1 Tax=Pandoraea sp. CB10b_02 TaxID=2014535 RepID=UPI00257A5D35|nr:FimV/HubP family polar landmark protein [Pandoraea sp. CB10b_02]
MRKYSIGKRANSSRNSFRLSAAAAVLWSLGLLNAGAAEFGPQQVRSGPGQPLRAVIVLGNVSQAEADGLSVKLAPREAFRHAGLRYDPTLEKLSVSVSPTGGREPGYSGTYLVHVDSAEPVSTSFLDLLLVLEWRTGRQSSAVTLSAIPEASAAQPQAVVPAAVAAATPAAASSSSASPSASRPAPASAGAAASAHAPAGSSAAVAASPDGARTVGAGESLSSIAREFTGGEGGTTLAQMMTALFEANRSAFIGNDPNRLRKGATLNRPADDQVQSIPPAQARKFVAAAREQFDAYRARLADSAAQQAAPAGGRSAQGAIEAGKAPEAAAPATRDELKLSRPGKGGAAGASGRASGSEEEQIAQGKAQAEAQGRVNELQKNVADLQKLLAMKNQAVASLEEQAATASGASTQDKTAKSADGKATAAAAAAGAKNAGQGAGARDTAAAANAANAANAADVGASAATASAASDATASSPVAEAGASQPGAAASAAKAEAAASAPAADAQPAANAGMSWRAVRENPYLLPGAGALAVLLGLWWLMRRGRAATPAGQPGPYDDGRDDRGGHGGPDSHDERERVGAPHDAAQEATSSRGAAPAGAVAAAGAAGAAALYAANQAEADEHLHPPADDTWAEPADAHGVAALDETPPGPVAAGAGAPGEWGAEQEHSRDEPADTARAETSGEPLGESVHEALQTAAEPVAGEPLAVGPESAVQAAGEPEIDWDAAFAEQAGEAPTPHDDPVDATLSSLEALSVAGAAGGAATVAGTAAAAAPHPEGANEANQVGEANEANEANEVDEVDEAPESIPSTPSARSASMPGAIAADAVPEGGVAGMLGDLDLSIPGQPAHVGTISSDALPSLTQGLGSVQFKMAPLGSPAHEEAAAEADAAEFDGELSDADFDAAMAQARAASQGSRGSYVDQAHEVHGMHEAHEAHEAPSLKPMSFDLSDFSLDLKGDDAPVLSTLPSAMGEQARVEHETLAAPAPDTPYAGTPAAPQAPELAPAAASAPPTGADPIVPHAVATASGEPQVPDEFHTKLELAMAYQSIGDDDGARELLEEVIAGGDAAQQSVARARLAELGK